MTCLFVTFHVAISESWLVELTDTTPAITAPPEFELVGVLVRDA